MKVGTFRLTVGGFGFRTPNAVVREASGLGGGSAWSSI